MAKDAKKQKESKPKSPDEPDQLDGTSVSVKIYSPFKVYFNGPATSISAENDTGPFDILPKHHNFMTLLNAGEVKVVKDDGSEQRYRIARGIMHVKKNQVIVFLDV